MDENTAVSWSDLHAATRNMNSEIRNRIYEKLLENIDFERSNGRSDEFLLGMQTALHSIIETSSGTSATGQEQLF